MWIDRYLYIVNLLAEINLASVIFRISLAMLCGGLIGIERGRANQPAGMRTYMLVCLGAAMVMMTGQYTYQQMQEGDPTRLGAQVVSGIGFLGAGSIISGKTRVKGLTTAAGLWASACIGLCIGIGFYSGAICAAVPVYLIISKFRTIENHFTYNDTWLYLYVEFESMKEIPECSRRMEESGLEIGELKMNKKAAKDKFSAILTIKNPMRKSREEIWKCLSEISGISNSEFI